MPDTPGARHRLRLVEDVVEVCLDSAEENMVSAMALRASALLDARWNGWARPLATASAMRDFLNRWRLNDPNGTWGHAIEEEGRLVYSSPDSDDPDLFPRAWVPQMSRGRRGRNACLARGNARLGGDTACH